MGDAADDLEGQEIDHQYAAAFRAAWRATDASWEKVASQSPVTPPICPYCGSTAVCIDSAEIYGGRSYGWAWECEQCDGVYVGCHKGTNRPLGRLANAELRAAKMHAHAAFDPLWKSGTMTRTDAYRWLATALGVSEAHIGEMDVDQCRRVAALCNERKG